MQDTGVQSLGWDDSLEKELATYSSPSCLENSTKGSLVGYSSWDQSWTQVSDFHFQLP